MGPTDARDLLERARAGFAPDPGANRTVPLVERGEAGPGLLLALALEERAVVAADRRAFLRLAERAAGMPRCAAYYAELARGEEMAAERLDHFVRAVEQLTDSPREARGGGDGGQGYEPRPGCQAYPAFVAWLALNAAPAGTVLALAANFSAWGGYCGRIAKGLREHYGMDDTACGFFDLFAGPSPEHEGTVLAAVQEWSDAGRIDEAAVRTHGRLLRSYEAGFWDALLDGR
ncbi:transcriptional regulator [Streptomyces sp. UH6]|uniref:transcriptional regulator n=1 Tax=Streptomyces sp. UH6 TaxID=2748379 RepID=UPI0015D47BF7|nr:transcriptional regulator [Streptomyces sp. UH6]NYV74206.1 transcriptional regulator [Streptomyces sp. UH6]